MRKCEDCGKEDAPYYDYRQKCTCDSDRNHGIERHKPECFRVRHSITPYLTQLRKVRRGDQFSDGQLLAPPNRPHEYARLIQNGFRIRVVNGYLYSDRTLCMNCVRIWAEREENRKHFERAKRGGSQQNYYQVLTSQ